MYTAVSMPGETGPLTSASLGSAIENGGRERGCQLRHPASKCRTAAKRLSVRGTGRHQSCDRFAPIRNCDLLPLSNLSDQGGQVLPGFAYSRFFHAVIVLHVLHVALSRNYHVMPRSLDLDCHAHPRVNTTLEKMFAPRQTRDLQLAALKDASPGHRDVLEAADAFGSCRLSSIEGRYEPTAEFRHLGEGVRLTTLVDYDKGGSLRDRDPVRLEVPGRVRSSIGCLSK